jgi:hypothetical protein
MLYSDALLGWWGKQLLCVYKLGPLALKQFHPGFSLTTETPLTLHQILNAEKTQGL